jgi:peptidoglycan/LPS O-acetylase OafA/YrhL
MMPMSDANRGAIQNIQFLRGFSALLVVLFHLGPIYEPLGVPQFGGGGVDVFFVISGFLMASYLFEILYILPLIEIELATHNPTKFFLNISLTALVR